MPTRDAFPAETLDALEYSPVLDQLVRHAATPAGARALRAATPAMAATERDARRDRGREAWEAVRAGRAPGIQGVGDLGALVDAAGKRLLEGEELLVVADALDQVRGLTLWSAQHPQYTALARCLAGAPPERDLREALRAAIGRRGEVLDEAHPDLGYARRKVRELDEQRGRKMDEVAGRLEKQGVLRQRHAVRRGDRLLLALRATDAGRAKGVVHDRSQSGDTLFVEPGEVLELSNRLVEAQSRVHRLEQEVLTELTRRVLRARAPLAEVEERLARVDLAFAAAHWAADTGAVYPAMEGGVLELREARHPLLVAQLGADEVVPLTLELGRDHELMVVTGPNTGGKTVVLKTVGVLAALALAGLPTTAAEGSCVPALAGLHADIGDAQSLESSLSTFSGHLKRILRILDAVRPGALVLLDELGTGTDPDEGAAIGQAVLEALLEAGALAIANTHLGQLKIFSTDVPRAENASMEFDPETLGPRYRLLVGVPGASHAIEVAERLGMPAALRERARALVRSGGGGAEKLLAEVGRVRRDAELLREKARDHETEARATRERIEEDERAARHRAELRQAEAEHAFVEHCRRIGVLLDEHLAPLRKQARGSEAALLDALAEGLRAELTACALGERWRAFVAGLRKGDLVYVPRFRDRLQVLKVHRNRETLKLRHGNLEVELPWRDVTWVEPPPGSSADAS